MGSWFSRPQNHERIILCGPSGAGKDHDARALATQGYTTGISHTTRPPRDNEVNGVDYHFVNEDAFNRIEFYEEFSHGEYRYGMSYNEWNHKQIFVFNPDGIHNVGERGDRDKVFVIYLDIPENVRNVRLVEKRGWSEEELAARVAVDRPAFNGFTDYNLCVVEGDHDICSIVEDILQPADLGVDE
jgi:guanylate kinase